MFSIITPTYNRSHTLPRVYESLIHQTFKEFTWIIVDDCSNDGTEALVDLWIKESKISIEYFKLKKNRGKPNAVNYGLDKCERAYTIIADSDDSFSANTLEDLLSIWKFIDSHSQKICAIWTLTRDQQNNVQGDLFPKDIWQASFNDRILNVERKLLGDKWHCWKTEILKIQKLYANDKCHIQESLTWNDINKKYDFLCLNISFLNVFYTEGSLINSKKSRRENSMTYYYGSFYGLRNISTLEILSNKYYRYLGFEYAKTKLFYSDKSLKLSTPKLLICWMLFISQIPRMVFKHI